MIFIGAIQQLVPVLGGVALWQSLWVARLVHGGLVVGTLLLSTGLYLGESRLLLSAALLLLLAHLLFILVVAAALWQARRYLRETLHGLALLLPFVVTLVGFGIWLILARSGWLTQLGYYEILRQSHIIVAVGGWFIGVVVAVALQLVPMFQTTPPYPRRFRVVMVPLWIVLLWGGLFIDDLRYVALAWLALFSVVTLWLQQHRMRKVADVTVSWWRSGVVVLLLISLMGLLHPWIAQLFNYYSLTIALLWVGAVLLPLMVGMLYKIIPFLCWLHLHNRQLALWQQTTRVKIPNMRQFVSERSAQWLLYLWYGMVPAILLLNGYADSAALILGGVWLLFWIGWSGQQYAAIRTFMQVDRQLKLVTLESAEHR